MTLKVTAAERLDRQDPQIMIEVHALSSHGGKHEWTVTFNKDGTIKHGYCYAGGHTLGLQGQHLIPQEIKEAARHAYSS